MDEPQPIDLDDLKASPHPRYSICTLVTRAGEYAEMVASCRAHGFSEPECEFIFANNVRGNRYDGFSGYNAFLSLARGDVVIICHQDVLLIGAGRAELDARLAELAAIDPLWAVCGNAGRTLDGTAVVRISDPYGEDRRKGAFPAPVLGVDENFVVVRRAANLGLSPHLRGFHFYAKALCGVADDLGLKSYVIDFHLRHKSGGYADASYWTIRDSVMRLRRRQYRPRLIASNDPNSAIFTSSSAIVTRVANVMARWRFKRLIARWVKSRDKPAAR